jgi:hypothetical protein
MFASNNREYICYIDEVVSHGSYFTIFITNLSIHH